MIVSEEHQCDEGRRELASSTRGKKKKITRAEER